jgi:hypothetical protein
MNKYEGPRQFAGTRPVRKTIERGVSVAKEATKVAEHSLSSSLASMRELNGKLIDMSHANADAVFDLAHELASAQAPSDLTAIWSAHARRQLEMMTTQVRELTLLGQKFASRSTDPFKRTFNEIFRHAAE